MSNLARGDVQLQRDEVHPDVAWAKLRALVEGSRIASRKLWKG